MTIVSRRSVAIAGIGMVLAFGAAFAVGRALAGGGGSAPSPAPFAVPKSLVTIRGFALPAGLPSLKQAPGKSAPASPEASPSGPSTSPGGGSSGGGGGGGPVIVG
jgi:hypothetical protein